MAEQFLLKFGGERASQVGRLGFSPTAVLHKLSPGLAFFRNDLPAESQQPVEQVVGRQQGASATQFRHVFLLKSNLAGTALRSFRPTSQFFNELLYGYR